MLNNLPPSIRRYVTPVAVVVGLAVVMLLSNRPAVSENGLPIVGNGDQYNDVLKDVQALSEGPIKHVNAGDTLSEAEVTDLRKASGLVDSMNRFLPTAFAPFLLAAKIYQNIGSYETARDRVDQAILNGKQELKEVKARGDDARAEEIRLTLNECVFVRSDLDIHLNDFPAAWQDACQAVAGVPNNPDYLVARARAALQLKDIKRAKADVAAAMQMEPTNKRAQALALLLIKYG